MSTCFPRYGLLVPFLALATAGCDRASVSLTAPPSGVSAVELFAVEPDVIRAETRHVASCGERPGFGARLTIIITGRHGLIIRGLSFRFTDRFGRRAFPDVMSLASLSSPVSPASNLPTSSPIPVPGVAVLPGASPIPIPGSSPVTGLFIPTGTSRRLPFDLTFGCTVVADGILRISADAGDRSGRFDISELDVRVGS